MNNSYAEKKCVSRKAQNERYYNKHKEILLSKQKDKYKNKVEESKIKRAEQLMEQIKNGNCDIKNLINLL
jgi:hypothetical protein